MQVIFLTLYFIRGCASCMHVQLIVLRVPLHPHLISAVRPLSCWWEGLLAHQQPQKPPVQPYTADPSSKPVVTD